MKTYTKHKDASCVGIIPTQLFYELREKKKPVKIMKDSKFILTCPQCKTKLIYNIVKCPFCTQNIDWSVSHDKTRKSN